MYSFRFALTEEDVFIFNRFHVRNSPTAGRTFNRFRLLMPALMLLVAAVNSVILETKAVILGVTAALIIVWFLVYGRLIDFSIRRSLRRMKKSGAVMYDQEIILEFDDLNVTEKSEGIEATIDYSVIESVESDKSGVYLYNTSQSARVIPARVFESPEEKERFVEFIRTRI